MRIPIKKIILEGDFLSDGDYGSLVGQANDFYKQHPGTEAEDAKYINSGVTNKAQGLSNSSTPPDPYTSNGIHQFVSGVKPTDDEWKQVKNPYAKSINDQAIHTTKTYAEAEDYINKQSPTDRDNINNALQQGERNLGPIPGLENNRYQLSKPPLVHNLVRAIIKRPAIGME